MIKGQRNGRNENTTQNSFIQEQQTAAGSDERSAFRFFFEFSETKYFMPMF
jgi:hypothetical protein